ncbi:MAG: PilT/PilU family type 4a pilus ATPase [Victivallaceae bacterium]|nr:PilT/PilU family type 4a pilus ATPase [Victivallaceae bacterium]
MAVIDKYLTEMLDKGGSDLHLSISQPPKIRVSGDLQPLEHSAIDAPKMEALLHEICLESRWQRFLETHDLDFAHEIPGIARFRSNYLYNHFGMAAVFRQIPTRIATLNEMNLPEVLKDICKYKSGFILVTGPTGSGKSTTLAAMMDHINLYQKKHIITIEDPIEFVHQNKNSIIVHREIGLHSRSFPEALRGAMRSDPDIILIGEMRDLETIRLGLTCATMGMLVFATLHTNNAPKTVDRIIDAFPAAEQAQIRTMLAECLQGVVSQLLCRKISGGRVACHEVLLWADGLPSVIREGKISNIRTIIEANKNIGMCSMDSNLKELYESGQISIEEAYMKASDKNMFLELMKEAE